MTKDDIDKLMNENNIVVAGEAVYALVKIVIEREREECAKVCDNYPWGIGLTEKQLAQAIRARGDK